MSLPPILTKGFLALDLSVLFFKNENYSPVGGGNQQSRGRSANNSYDGIEPVLVCNFI